MMTTSTIETLWHAGKREEAIEIAKSIVKEFVVTENKTQLLDIADVLQKLAEETGMCRDADNAMDIATLLRHCAWPDYEPQSVHANQGLIAWLARTGRYKEAKDELAQSLALAERFVSQTQVPLVTILNISANIACETGQIEDAIAFLKRAIRVEQTNPSKNFDELGSLFRTLAELFLRLGRIDEAVTALESSLQIPNMRLSGSEEAEVLSKIAHLRESQGQIKIALSYMTRAVDRCQADLGFNHYHTKRHQKDFNRLSKISALYESKDVNDNNK